MKKAIIVLSAALALASCGLSDPLSQPGIPEESGGKISLGGEIDQIYLTRASDSGFADKDEIGVYIVDYDNAAPGTLQSSGNRADNVKHTFDEASYKWVPAKDIYWKDKQTHIDVYGYYPYGNVSDVDNYTFTVSSDQRSTPRDGELGGYEKSDFLWGKVTDVAPTDKLIKISFHHRMAGIKISLTEGEGFADGEWASAGKNVLITGTRLQASANLAAGEVHATGDAGTGYIIPQIKGDEYRAVVAPQQIAAGTQLLAISVEGRTYKFSREETTELNSGKQHNFTISVNKKPDGDFEFSLAGQSITEWENDPISHDGTAKEYIVVNVETAGTLDECLKTAGKEASKVKNLKLTGTINARDFAVMKYWMTSLSSLNLKEVNIARCESGSLEYSESGFNTDYWYNGNETGELPSSALSDKNTLLHLILPDSITKIGQYAFGKCENLSGSLIIPEGVTSIEATAFYECRSLTSLSLPMSLKYIGENAFHNCGFTCELLLPENLEHIGSMAFYSCTGLYGSLNLPEGIKHLGENVFGSCSGFSGSLTIPDGLTTIGSGAFGTCYGLDGSLTLPDNLTSIGSYAFGGTSFTGELVLPEGLLSIGSGAFNGCKFSGRLALPEGLQVISDEAFYGTERLSGTLFIPEDVVSIGKSAFVNSGIESVVLPANLEVIKDGAFYNCFNLSRIVCKSEIPPYIMNGAFDGVSKENFTVEVPESAVAQYRTAPGWNEFKRISAYRNLSVSPAMLSALNSKATRNLMLYSEGDWTVESKPDWVNLSPSEGSGKSSISLEFSQKPSGAPREGEVVFKLKDKDYRTACKVSQYDFNHAEDEILTIQTASKGPGINIVLLGDGYSAKDISEGKLLSDINEAAGHFFSIEPYKTYKEYFNVYAGISVSPESGVGGVNTIVYNRFNTTAKDGGVLGGRNGTEDLLEILRYALKAPTVNEGNLAQTLTVIIPNTAEYGGTTYLFDDGTAISYCPKSSRAYPYDFRGIIQHEAGGHGFGKLGEEYIVHNAYIDACCNSYWDLLKAFEKGWFSNLSLSGNIGGVIWSHLLFHEKYKDFVDIYEGGFMHSRGVFRSEYNSCMNNCIPYYSTISRELIVRRIKSYAGEEFSFEDFADLDNIDGRPTVTSSSLSEGSTPAATYRHAPVMAGKRPSIK